MTPSISLTHLGEVINTQTSQVFLSQECRASIRGMMEQIKSSELVPLLFLSQLLGKMISCLAIVLGSVAYKGLTMAPFTQSETRVQQFNGQDQGSQAGPPFPGLVDVSRHGEQLSLPRTGADIGCQSLQLECPPVLQSDTRLVVSARPAQRHQLAGAESGSSGATPLSNQIGRLACDSTDGQCNSQSAHQQTGRH